MWGGVGADTFVVQAGHGNDTIKDFGPNQGDRIDLSAFTGITAFSDLTITQEDDGVKIDLSGETGGGSIMLENRDLDDLSADDFQFYTPDPSVEGL